MIAAFLHLTTLTSDKIQWHLFAASDDINIRENSMVSLFTASDDINIRQNSIIPVFRHLMILTDKIWWYLRKFNGSCFSASDDINIRQNSMRALFLPYANPFILRASCSCLSRLLRQAWQGSGSILYPTHRAPMILTSDKILW